MRRLILLTLLAAAGCQSSRGSLGYDQSSRGNDPKQTIAEQKAWNRERYPVIEDDRLTPKAYVDRPSFTGR